METLLLLLQILLINIVLSGDNAVVIALASKKLPEEQRKKAVWWGATGAVLLRIVLTFAAVLLLDVPYIQVAGGILLLYIAVKLMLDDGGHSDVKAAPGLWSAVWTIIVADFVMSLDNVLAVAAIAKDNVLVLILGIVLSIPLIIWGSHIIMRLLSRYPVLNYLGAGILGFAAGEMIIADQAMIHFMEGRSPSLHWLFPVGFPIIVIASGLMKKLLAPRAI
nr:TerC family protein [Paenibacillus turpanensis]